MIHDKNSIIEDFRKDINCSQSVFSAFSGPLNIDKDLSLSISSGFGAGMGRLQKTCGAVTGAYMVIGLIAGKLYSENNLRKEYAYNMIADFTHRFELENGSSDCAELTGCDLNTPGGRAKFKNEKTAEIVCEKCVLSSIKILEKLSGL